MLRNTTPRDGFDYYRPQINHGLYYGFGGALFGGIATIASHPADSLKVYYQNGGRINCKNYKNWLSMKNICWAYQGVTPSIPGYCVEKAIVFGTYKATCNVFELDEYNPSHSYIAGLASGTAAAFSITFFEQLKVNLQTETKHNYSMKELFKGLPPTILRDGFGFCIYFTVFNQCTKYLNKDEKNIWAKISKAGGIGAFSAFCAWIPIFPIDKIKTWRQSNTYKNQMHIYKNTRGLLNRLNFMYQGFWWGMARAAPFHAVCFMGLTVLEHHEKRILSQ
jgi:Mitochondrial carrier protein